MGAPDPAVLTGELFIASHSDLSSDLRSLYEDMGAPEGHGLFTEAYLNASQIQSLQQSLVTSPNEVTADAFLNWIVHQTSDDGAEGFTDAPEGCAWQEFMGRNMDKWLRYAIAYNVIRSGNELSLTADEAKLMPFPLPVERGVTAGSKGPYVRTGPSRDYSKVGKYALPLGHEVIVLGRDERGQDPYNDWVAVLYRGDVNWIYKGGVRLPDGVDWDDLPILDKDTKLELDPNSSIQEIDSWFQVLLKAAFGR